MLSYFKSPTMNLILHDDAFITVTYYIFFNKRLDLTL